MRSRHSSLMLLALASLALSPGCGDDGVSATADGTDGSTDDEVGETTTSGEDTSDTSTEGSTTEAETETETDSSEDTTTGGPATPLQAGVAMRPLHYPVGISLAGYGGRVGGINTAWSGLFWGTKGFYSYPTIKAMVLDDGEGDRVILMKTPMMSGESGVTDAVAAKYMELYGEDIAGRVIWGGTHSHHAHGRYWRLPDIFGAVGADTADEEVIDLIATEFAMTIKEAADAMGDAEFGWTTLDDWDPDDKVYGDRRGENDPTYGKDPRLTVLGLRRPDGTPLAALFNFAMHGISVAYENELLSEDAPGAVELAFEEYFFEQTGEPIFGLFSQAGAGDASPRGGFLGHDPATQRMEMIGTVASPVIFDAYQNLDWTDDPDIDVASRRVDLTYEKFGYHRNGEFSGELFDLLPIDYTWGGWQCTGVAGDNDPNTSMEGLPKQCIPVDTLLIGNDVPHAEVHQTYLSVAKVGSMVISTIPGEPNYSLVKYARDEFAALMDQEGIPVGPEGLELMVWGYSQDHLLYFSAPDDWYQGGYEAEMSLWGPFGGSFMVDTTTAVLADMLAGQAGDVVLVEESPSLASPGGFTPRAYEFSQNVGEVVGQVDPERQRTEVARFRFGGGDPSIGAPNVRLQVDDGEGFVDVPHPAGFAGMAYDNSRAAMITRYDPDPAPNGQVLSGREHEWYVDWEVPADWPAGTYRFVASGPWWNASEVVDYEAVGLPFAVTQHQSAALTANLSDASTLNLTLILDEPEYVEDGSTPEQGWILHDAWHGPGEGIHVRAPLSLQFTVDGALQPEVYAAEYDAEADLYVFDFGQTGIDANASVEVEAWLAEDLEPAVVGAPVSGP
ncbi:neutral/alkaline non-lysosomal ceramidase N-terminal domain-containing protein [Plesiocystis pacifica]|nr:neutral/alkaline non-lysosomal ceramidase N-terminal domain-containing protein [Plesiocystis pacifica]